MNPDSQNPFVASLPNEHSRAKFIRKTYLHLAGAVLAFVGIESVLIPTQAAADFASLVLGSGSMGWLMFIGAFMLSGWMARSLAARSKSKAVQYTGLALYVVFEAIFFIPVLYIATYYSNPNVLASAGIMTGLLFAGLTATAFITRKDFSFLKGILTIGFFLAIGAIACGVIFGFNLGMGFSFLMVAFAAGAILYDTSNIIHHYHEDQYVGASLELFASVALLFWYVLRIFMSRD